MSTNSTSRQRKTYIAILTLALGGLAVDRLVLDSGGTGPSASLANELSSLPSNGTAVAGAVTTTPMPVTRTKTLAGRLDEIALKMNLDASQVEDAFRPASSWLSVTKAKAQPTVAVNETDQFTKKHKLLALVNNAQGGAAIINNQTVILGKVVDGFTLVEVSKRSAIFEKSGQRVELKLPAPAGSISLVGD